MTDPDQREPRWPGLVAMVATGCIYMALPEPISAGPGWLLLAVVFVLLIPIVFTYRAGRYTVARNLAFVANGVITLALILSLGFLIQGLPHHRESPSTLLRSAAGLWVTNILVFALWYWKLDAGGPWGVKVPEVNWTAPSFFLKWRERTARASLGRRNSWTICFSRLIPAQPSRQPTQRFSRAGPKWEPCCRLSSRYRSSRCSPHAP